jgi:hypothetical protein
VPNPGHECDISSRLTTKGGGPNSQRTDLGPPPAGGGLTAQVRDERGGATPAAVDQVRSNHSLRHHALKVHTRYCKTYWTGIKQKRRLELSFLNVMWNQGGKCPGDSHSSPVARLFTAVHHLPALTFAYLARCEWAILAQSLRLFSRVPGLAHFARLGLPGQHRPGRLQPPNLSLDLCDDSFRGRLPPCPNPEPTGTAIPR